jgi:hypothetical protein
LCGGVPARVQCRASLLPCMLATLVSRLACQGFACLSLVFWGGAGGLAGSCQYVELCRCFWANDGPLLVERTIAGGSECMMYGVGERGSRGYRIMVARWCVSVSSECMMRGGLCVHVPVTLLGTALRGAGQMGSGTGTARNWPTGFWLTSRHSGSTAPSGGDVRGHYRTFQTNEDGLHEPHKHC